jgi:hypothetical protein
VFSSRKQGSKYVQNTLLAPQEGLSGNAKKTLINIDARGLSSNARRPNNNAKKLQ